jgi:hypothetical protein
MCRPWKLPAAFQAETVLQGWARLPWRKVEGLRTLFVEITFHSSRWWYMPLVLVLWRQWQVRIERQKNCLLKNNNNKQQQQQQQQKRKQEQPVSVSSLFTCLGHHICMCIYVHIMYIYVHIYVYVYICMYRYVILKFIFCFTLFVVFDLFWNEGLC